MHTSNRPPNGPLSWSTGPTVSGSRFDRAPSREPPPDQPTGTAEAAGKGRPPAGSDEWLARQVARAASSFEHALLGRAPTSVTVVGSGGWMVVHLQEPFSQLERRLTREDRSAARRVVEFHHHLFDQSIEALCEHVQRTTGVAFRGGLAHIDPATGSILKTLATEPQVDVFLMGRGLPALGVPVNTHLQAGPPRDGRSPAQSPPISETPGLQLAAGNGAGRR